MPFCKCPRCGNVAHLHLKISRYEWYRRYFPTHDPRQPAPAICARCWVREHGLETEQESNSPLSHAPLSVGLPADGGDSRQASAH